MRHLKRLIRRSYRALLGLIEAAREIKAERDIFGEDGMVNAIGVVETAICSTALGFMIYVLLTLHAAGVL